MLPIIMAPKGHTGHFALRQAFILILLTIVAIGTMLPARARQSLPIPPPDVREPVLAMAEEVADAIPQAPSVPVGSTGAVIVGERVVLYLRASVGSITPSERAAIINQRIRRVLSEQGLKPEGIVASPAEDSGAYQVGLPGLILIGVTPQDAEAESITVEQLADRWAHTLRESLVEVKPLYRGEEPHKASYLPLLLVSGLAFLVPFVAARSRRLRIPVVVGEILVGILIGRSGFNLVRDESSLQFLSEFGFAFLMFLSGLEVDVDLFVKQKQGDVKTKGTWYRNPTILGVMVLLITMVLALGVAFLFMRTGLVQQPYLMALVLSTTSLGLVVPILKEQGLTVKPFGQTLLLAALVADFVTMFLITIVAGLLSVGPTLNLFLSLLLIGAFIAAMRIGRLLQGHQPLRSFLQEKAIKGANQVAVRGSIVLMLAFVALSETLGTEVILGAFLAGVLLALFLERGEGELKEKLEGFGFGFVIPIFFIMVGVRFDLRALVSSPQGLLLAPLLVIAALGIKIVAALPFRLVVPWRETIAGGFLMASRLSLIIAAAEIGLRLGVFGETLHAAIICVALITCVVGPLGFQAFMPKNTDDHVSGDAK